jgi:hypothetical protein
MNMLNGKLTALKESLAEQFAHNFDWWSQVTGPVMIKTALTLFVLESELEKSMFSLTAREKDVLRWTVLYLHIGSAKKESKTSK